MANELIVENIGNEDIRNMIHLIRGQYVMIDRDLANLYGVETKRLNEQVKRNIKRFPSDFCFQLTAAEDDNLRSQIATSSRKHGGRRYLPYVFTEAGVAMLSAVLSSEVAVETSVRIMNTFVEMRRFIVNNAALFERISAVELKQLEYQKDTDRKLDEIFTYIADHAESNQKLFFEGQIYDAFSLITSIIRKSGKMTRLVDNYVDISTLNILSKKNPGVSVTVYTNPKTHLTKKDVETFNGQYPDLTVKYTDAFHDRFLVLDDLEAYIIGASLKDAGKKCFGLIAIDDSAFKKNLVDKLNTIQ